MRKDVKAMQVFIDSMVGISKFSYPAKKNAPRPEGEFATVQLIEQYTVGLPVKTTLSEFKDDNSLVGVGERDLAVGAVFRVDSAVRLRFRVTVIETTGLPSTLIENGWTSEQMKQLMVTSGYGFLGAKPISLEDALLEKEWEARQGFSIELSTTRTYKETLDYITQVTNILGEFYEGDDVTFMNIEVNP